MARSRSKVPRELHLLPADVLRDILSRLSLKEAVRMSELSREWRRQGICHPDLVFTQDTLFGSNKTRDTKLEPMAAEFVTIVDNVLRPLWSTFTTTTTTVDKFVVKFALKRQHKHHIDEWIDFSVASMAKHIGLYLFDWSDREDDKYTVPLCKLSGQKGSCANSLDFAYVCIKLPPRFRGISNLKKLSLHMVSIDVSDLECLLISCGLLESLSLERCPLSSLCVSRELCKLQHLSVRECGAAIIQLEAPNLTTFDFDDCLTEIVLSESSKLSEATFVFKNDSYDLWCDEFEYIMTQLPTSVPYVHRLFLHMVFEYEVQNFSKSQDNFVNLTHLNLNINLENNDADTGWYRGLINLLELAPMLAELELHIDCYKLRLPDRAVAAVPGPLHRHLRSVHITGFSDFVGVAELTLYILGNATVLERMVVDPGLWMDYVYTGQFFSVSRASSSQKLVRPRFTKYEQLCREFARKHLDREEFRHILTIV